MHVNKNVLILQLYLYVLRVLDKDFTPGLTCENTLIAIEKSTGKILDKDLELNTYEQIISELKLNYGDLFQKVSIRVNEKLLKHDLNKDDFKEIKNQVFFDIKTSMCEFISIIDDPTLKDIIVLQNYRYFFDDTFIKNTFSYISNYYNNFDIESLKCLRVAQRAINKLSIDAIKQKKDYIITFKLINNLTHKQLEKYKYQDIVRMFNSIGVIEEKLLQMPFKKIVDMYAEQYKKEYAEPQGLVPYLKSFPPKYAIFENTKLANERSKKFVGQGEITLMVGGNNKNMATIAKIDILDNKNVITTEEITPYDEAVYSGILSLMQLNNEFFASQVYRAMTGDKSSKYIKPATLRKVIDSIDKMARTRIYIDATNHNDKMHGFETTVDEQMINVKGVQRKAKDQIIKAYQLLNEPIMFRYAKAIGKENPQLITAPNELMDLTGYVSATEKNIIIRNYLIRRIGQMKVKNALLSNKIKYETLINSCKLNVVANKKSALRDTIKLIMDSFVCKNQIDSYLEYKVGRCFEGLEINLRKA